MQTNSGFFSLAKETNLMLFSKEISPKKWLFLESFQLFHHEHITPQSIDSLQTTLQALHINIIIVEAQEHHPELYALLSKILNFNKELILISVINQKFFDATVINLSHRVCTAEITPELFERNVFAALKEVALFKHKELFKNTSVNQEELEIIYLCESLESASRALDSGDLSEDIFEGLKKDLAHVEILFGEYMIQSRRIKSIISNFSSFIYYLDIQDVSFEAFEAFEHLSRVVEDIAVFLRQYFLERKFEDLYVIEDSLGNSIEFLRRKFSAFPAEKDGSQVEFFDD